MTDLQCTNCGEFIWVDVNVHGFVYIECGNISCGASWSKTGVTTFPGFESEKK